MNIKELLKNKKIVFSVIAFVLFLVFFVGNYFTKEAYASSVYFANYYQPMRQLCSGDVIEQKLKFKEGDEGVSVILGTYAIPMGGGCIEAELFDESGAKVDEVVKDLTGHPDNYGAVLHFGKLDENLYGQIVTLRMTFQDIDNELVTVYGSITDLDKYEATLNGEPLGWNITMDGIKETVFVEYRDFRNFFVGVLGIAFAYVALFKINWKEIKPRKMVQHAVDIVKMNWKKILLVFGMMIPCGIVGVKVEELISKDAAYTNPYRAYAIAVLLFVVLFANVFRKYIWEKVHIYFMILVMLAGSIYIFAQPPTAISHDEQFHYTQTAYISYGATNYISTPDYYILSRYTQQAYWDIFQKEQREAWVEEVNVIDGQDTYMPYLASTGIQEVPYYITAIALYVFRLLRLDFVTRFLLGKFINLFIYASCFGISIKLLKGRGKLLIAMVGLIPTNIIMAASYGYDWWIIALVALGFAIFISELQKHDKISTSKFALSTAIICIGMLPKVVYVPLLFPMMLLKKERYEDSKKCRMITVIGAVALALSLILPMVISINAGDVAGGGDIRGGSDVNASGQIAFILSNFGEYMKVMFGYMKEYLDPDKTYAILTATAYHGKGSHFTVALMTLAIAAIVDNSEKTVFKGREPLAVVGNYIGNFGAVVLVITALYVGYTAVGSPTVSGCQPRYLLPILFPFLYFAGENKLSTSNELKEKLFIWGAVAMLILLMITVNDAYMIVY